MSQARDYRSESVGRSAVHGSRFDVNVISSTAASELFEKRPKGEVAMDESTSVDRADAGSGSDQRIGSYRVLQPLGSGGMSSVFRAVHEETGTRSRSRF